MAPPARLLVLGGTTEAADLVRRLHAPGGLAGVGQVEVTTSLAGRTARPAPLPGGRRVGGFGGPEGLARYLADEGIDVLVDATHPFAAHMPWHAAEAAAATGVRRLRLLRPGWSSQPGDRWHVVADLDAAGAELARQGRHRVFLTTGRQELAPFAALADAGTWFLIRTIDPPDPQPLVGAVVVLSRGPFDVAAERDLLLEYDIDALVTKDSGGDATSAKLDAARALGLDVVVVARPPTPSGPVVPDVDGALAWLVSQLGPAPGGG